MWYLIPGSYYDVIVVDSPPPSVTTEYVCIIVVPYGLLSLPLFLADRATQRDNCPLELLVPKARRKNIRIDVLLKLFQGVRLFTLGAVNNN